MYLSGYSVKCTINIAMDYHYFPKLFNKTHIDYIMGEIQGYLEGPTKSSAYDVEFDLTLHQAIPDIKQSIEKLVSKCFDLDLICYNYWISKSEKGEPVVEHHHVDAGSGAIASAVLYIQALDNTGQLYLKDYDTHITPNTGDLVVFPASCVHSVCENPSNIPRICVAFDLKLKLTQSTQAR